MSNSDSESSSEHYFSSTSFEFATVDGAVAEELSVLNVSDNTPDTSSDDGKSLNISCNQFILFLLL